MKLIRKIFNLWCPFPKYKPEKDGWYICSIKYGNDPGQKYVMDLYWYSNRNVWRDNRRQNVFDVYDVYGYNDKTHKNDKKLYTEKICIRHDVVAFKKLPKVYKK